MNIIEKQYAWAYPPSSRKASDIKYIILHHAAAVHYTADDVHRDHLANGWAGIGYNFFVSKDGKIYRGRGELQIGAHTEGYNTAGMGICAEGDFTREHMSEIQKQAIINLIKYLIGKYGKLPVKGHRDFDATACPGTYYPMDEIVAAVNGQALKPAKNEKNANQEECEVNLPLLGSGDSGNSVKALQQLLIARGYNCGGYGADGIFGAGTNASVRAYQRAKGLSVDGLVGTKTWSSLLL